LTVTGTYRQTCYRQIEGLAMLTPSAVHNSKGRDAAYKLADERGMYLLVKPDGARWWRLDYRRPVTGKRNTLSLGIYPDVSLKRAREKRDEARTLLADGIDPGAKRKADAAAGENTFEAIARQWLAKKKTDWTEKNEIKETGRLVNHCFPWIGATRIDRVTKEDMRNLLDRIVKNGTIDTARRARQTADAVFRYANGILDDPVGNPADALADYVPTHRKRQYSYITDPALLAELLRAIDGFTGSPVTRALLQLSTLLVLRPGELRGTAWADVDLDAATLKIPAPRRKLRKAQKEDQNTPAHVVPMPRQAVTILRELLPLTGNRQYVFPGVKDPKRSLSDATAGAALVRMGFAKDVIRPHGFRHTMKTLLSELGHRSEVTEAMLSHQKRGIEGVYDKATHFAERRLAHQALADHLDALRTSANVVPIKRKVS
jgi:integrase